MKNFDTQMWVEQSMIGLEVNLEEYILMLEVVGLAIGLAVELIVELAVGLRQFGNLH